MTLTHTLRRFDSKPIEPHRVMGLKPGHAALSDATTIFPKSVTDPFDSPRLLVSGHNNPKLGAKIRKGAFAGFPIFHLTLVERATCPKSCHMWAQCYGNSMPYARRHDPSNLLDFACVLNREIEVLQDRHPKGFMIRLHTLGDFPSLPYVKMWRHFLETYPALHCFGYTSNWYGAEDAEEADIGQAILSLTNMYWDRFAIRFSLEEPRDQSAIVVDAADTRPNVVMCPAQTKDSECCATCGLCWAPSLRGKAIGFLRHGMKKRGKANV